MNEFSVIIPTLQRSKELHALVEQCAAHPRVLEVLVINNALAPLAWESPKVRVLQQAENIYVNPAWNLGASEARGKYLAILNDDIELNSEVFDEAAKVLRRGFFSVVGPSRDCYDLPGGGPKRGHRWASLHPDPFGTAMFLRRQDYQPIPEDWLIWGGDDWLILNQRRPVAEFVGIEFRTDMSTTSSSPEFQEMKRRETARSFPVLMGLRGKRWWHLPSRAVGKLRGTSGDR